MAPRICDKCEIAITGNMTIKVTILIESANLDGDLEITKKKNTYCGFLCATQALGGVSDGPVPDPRALADATLDYNQLPASACAIANLCKRDPACGSYTPICSKTWAGP